MPELQQFVERLDSKKAKQNEVEEGAGAAYTPHACNKEVQIHPNFHLFLTSLPTDFFPVSILQKTFKVALEKPTGLL